MGEGIVEFIEQQRQLYDYYTIQEEIITFTLNKDI